VKSQCRKLSWISPEQVAQIASISGGYERSMSHDNPNVIERIAWEHL
jgi:hypothetical protein